MGTYKILLAIIIFGLVKNDCLKVKNCLCADNGAECLSAKSYLPDLVGHFTFDQQSENDDIGYLKIAPIPAIGPSYSRSKSLKTGPNSFALFSNEETVYTITGTALNGLTSTTISFWIYQIRRSNGWATVISRGGALIEKTPTIALSPKDGTIEVIVSTCSGKAASVMSRGGVVPQTWAHISVSVSQNIVAIYLNGILDTKQIISGTIKHSDSEIIIGLSTSRIGAEMYLDDLKFFNKVLSSEETVLDYQSGDYQLGRNTVVLSGLDFTFEEALKSCHQGYHLCSISEILGGAYRIAEKNGWLKTHLGVWSVEERGLKVTNSDSMRKVGLCCRDRREPLN